MPSEALKNLLNSEQKDTTGISPKEATDLNAFIEQKNEKTEGGRISSAWQEISRLLADEKNKKIIQEGIEEFFNSEEWKRILDNPKENLQIIESYYNIALQLKLHTLNAKVNYTASLKEILRSVQQQNHREAQEQRNAHFDKQGAVFKALMTKLWLIAHLQGFQWYSESTDNRNYTDGPMTEYEKIKFNWIGKIIDQYNDKVGQNSDKKLTLDNFLNQVEKLPVLDKELLAYDIAHILIAFDKTLGHAKDQYRTEKVNQLVKTIKSKLLTPQEQEQWFLNHYSVATGDFAEKSVTNSEIPGIQIDEAGAFWYGAYEKRGKQDHIYLNWNDQQKDLMFTLRADGVDMRGTAYTLKIGDHVIQGETRWYAMENGNFANMIDWKIDNLPSWVVFDQWVFKLDSEKLGWKLPISVHMQSLTPFKTDGEWNILKDGRGNPLLQAENWDTAKTSIATNGTFNTIPQTYVEYKQWGNTEEFETAKTDLDPDFSEKIAAFKNDLSQYTWKEPVKLFLTSATDKARVHPGGQTEHQIKQDYKINKSNWENLFQKKLGNSQLAKETIATVHEQISSIFEKNKSSFDGNHGNEVLAQSRMYSLLLGITNACSAQELAKINFIVNAIKGNQEKKSAQFMYEKIQVK